ncbi:guanine deaminase [Saccharopolyspora antimicrobica]|uniref:Guanine deaminase n=1 Tax=Saccharopolyspora antimicrobica TaxID=455193 RepID=A0A1I5I4K0_9PSEU|nr:nucleoside deaminase [Saccharopolyspora antimicrobica]RKT83037.1 guanine deaminase [Saccharopolyspora antimicrobica]SFO55524.1 guanine deaminase [Saccharopolyspora antimicrobica]
MSVDVATSAEQDWMARAIELATTNVAAGGGPFGALVVRDGEVIATGTNKVTVDLDPTAHAEVTAIRNACRALGTFKLDGCVLVTSCEPCPMCLASALWARVDRVLFAADRDDAAEAGFDDRAFYDVFEDPQTESPTPVQRVTMPDRNAAFDAWRGKSDRVDY